MSKGRRPRKHPPVSDASPGSRTGADLRRRRPGRPRLIETPEELTRRTDDYVAACKETGEPLTITGLALALGFTSRQSLAEYGERPEFADAVKRARLLVEEDYERAARTAKNPAGAIFGLKNLGWSDRQDIEFRGVLAGLDMHRLTDEQLQRVAAGEDIMAVLATSAAKVLGPGPAPEPES